MSLSATPATRNEATRRLKLPKVNPSGELTIGTAIWSSRGRLRTVADRRLRTVATMNATSSEHTLNPQTPRVKREPLLRIREKTSSSSSTSPSPLSLSSSWNVMNCHEMSWIASSGSRHIAIPSKHIIAHRYSLSYLLSGYPAVGCKRQDFC